MRIRILILVLLSLLSSRIAAKTVDCDYNTGYEECYLRLPYCRQYEISPDSDAQDFGTFTCLKCDAGFIPIPGGVKKVPYELSIPEFEKMGVEYIHLCKRVASPEGGLPCNNPVCQKELPQCERYSFQPISEEMGKFTCLSCNELFNVRENAPEAFPAWNTAVKHLCSRKSESRECGAKCQTELPGCKRYKVYRNTFEDIENGEKETAFFECLQAHDGYNIRNIRVKENTDPTIVKDLTIPLYDSPIYDCSDANCRHVLPNCQKYAYRGMTQARFLYICTQCDSNFQPKEVFNFYPSINLLAQRDEFVRVCEVKNIKNADCDDKCKQEFPGCDRLTIWEAGYPISEFIQQAKFRCDQCANGYKQINIDGETLVHANYPLSYNVKVRCQPEPVLKPKVCDEECRKKYPHCEQFIAAFDPSDDPSRESFRCVQCEEGYEHTTDPFIQFWFSGSPRVVCKRKITAGPVDCTGSCKDDFPNCERISISHGFEGHSEYRCHQCSAGFFPIAYDRDVPGKLGYRDGIMKDKPRIYLCAEKPTHVYNSLFRCDRKDFEIVDHDECYIQPNCAYLVTVRDLLRGRTSFRCIQCRRGFKLKKEIPHSYDLDQDQCERDSMTLLSTLLTASE